MCPITERQWETSADTSIYCTSSASDNPTIKTHTKYSLRSHSTKRVDVHRAFSNQSVMFSSTFVILSTITTNKNRQADLKGIHNYFMRWLIDVNFYDVKCTKKLLIKAPTLKGWFSSVSFILTFSRC